jgi:catechol 2,3-dioxygenase-like lactoylglutathione lyase family enzyme
VTVAFYRDALELPVIETWDRHPDDRGTLVGAASGMIEVLAFPQSGESCHLWDARPPQGAFMVIEVDQVEARYQRAAEAAADHAGPDGSGVGPSELLRP